MQKASGRVPKDAPTACGRTISGLFHSPSGVLFAFPSRYLFAIGHHGVIRLGGWSPQGAFTRCGRTFQSVRLACQVPCPGPATPRCKHLGLASRAFARHYSRARVCFPFLRVLRCFTSPGVAPPGLLNSSRGAMALAMAGCPIRRPPDQSPLTAPRRLSQSAASFFAS